MHPLIIVLGAALLDVVANMAINRSLGFRHKGWGLLGILLVLCAFTLLSEAVSTGRIDLAVAYATWGAIGILAHRDQHGEAGQHQTCAQQRQESRFPDGSQPAKKACRSAKRHDYQRLAPRGQPGALRDEIAAS